MARRWLAAGNESFVTRLSRRAALHAEVSAGMATALAPAAVAARQATPVARPAAVKVLTVTMYQDLTRLDDPLGGEASRWVTQHRLQDQIETPGSIAPVYCDAAGEHCLVVTGMGPVNVAATDDGRGRSDRVRRFRRRAGLSQVASRAAAHPAVAPISENALRHGTGWALSVLERR